MVRLNRNNESTTQECEHFTTFERMGITLFLYLANCGRFNILSTTT